MEINVDNERSRHILRESQDMEDYEEMDPGELFAKFFEETQGRELTEDESEVFQEILQGVLEKGGDD